MTQEEKAKAYDKVVNKLGRFMKQGIDPLITKADVQDFFPELRESEDERIRKLLISGMKNLKYSCETFASVPIKDVIDWLEKQGEQKPRYSIGDVLCDKSCTTLNKDAQSNFEIVDIRNGLYICDKGFFPISQQDEYELVAKKIEQKPAEWSKEDDKNLEQIIWYIKKGGKLIFAKTDNLVSWLKSLKERNTWKPSDEQIGVIEAVINNRSFQRRHLDSLYEQLKKLKE